MRPTHFKTQLLVLATLPLVGAACAQSVDCREAPDACAASERARLQVQRGNPPPPPPVHMAAARPAPTGAPRPDPTRLNREIRPTAIPPAVRPTTGDPKIDRLAAPEALRRPLGDPKEVLTAVADPIRNKDFETLARFMTARLRGALEDSMPTHGERFWRHMATYAKVLAGEYTVESAQDDQGRTALTLKNKAGDELKPILVREGEGLKVDRF